MNFFLFCSIFDMKLIIVIGVVVFDLSERLQQGIVNELRVEILVYFI